MANKYTRMIDEIFQRWDPKGETKYIYLGYCHKGDEDGGCDDYDHVCDDYWEIENQYPYKLENEICFFYVPKDAPKLSDEEIDAEREEYERQYDTLSRALLDGFGPALEPDYTSTNCYWYRHYFVTRDYKILSLVTRGDIDGDWHTEACINLLSEDEAENKADNQILDKIKEHISDIEDLLSEIEHDDNLDKAYALISQIPNHRKV